MRSASMLSFEFFLFAPGAFFSLTPQALSLLQASEAIFFQFSEPLSFGAPGIFLTLTFCALFLQPLVLQLNGCFTRDPRCFLGQFLGCYF
jgi:hypothetical protein